MIIKPNINVRIESSLNRPVQHLYLAIYKSLFKESFLANHLIFFLNSKFLKLIFFKKLFFILCF